MAHSAMHTLSGAGQLVTTTHRWGALQSGFTGSERLGGTPFLCRTQRRSLSRARHWFPCRASASEVEHGALPVGRRLVSTGALFAALAGASIGAQPASAASRARAARNVKVPEDQYTTLPNGLKIFDVTVGSGATATKGERVAVHYDVKWKGVTFSTSRMGQGVTGGTPYGFDVGASETGLVLKGLDYGVEGMRVGGQRKLLIPPELAYGKRGVQEIPPDATLEVDVELLSIKKNAFGTQVKLVEG
ncbi:FKBP-type peptidyl-prolyl cis-trans isomerase family protein [Klebsormidium nitens]|uniref:peptidylprolyl isomerase n=1 Tax=Klebsormidium nitens TaxID=105231 RepID=A0A1Y1I838_KLENI|nr:FKBP-type peptidyl-prolyl cis-trans isomerase family protein [Klebsormidium nitens]|eukprot:GAQ86112.1 FKBP-type peptidyl-prolyl cis-trans isomerase family protein [Klebsormidium nitens]